MKNMNVQTIWNIRDARGLTSNEKVFLFVIASRGVAKTSRQTLMEDTGLSDGSITNVSRSLKSKGLITVHPGKWVDGKKTQSMYVLNHDAVEELTQQVSHVGTDMTQEMSDMTQQVSEFAQEMSEFAQEMSTKVTKKVTKKGTRKETTASTAGAAAAEPSPKAVDTPELPDNPLNPGTPGTPLKVNSGTLDSSGESTLSIKELIREERGERAVHRYEELRRSRMPKDACLKIIRGEFPKLRTKIAL